jgi:hypothetical protein
LPIRYQPVADKIKTGAASIGGLFHLNRTERKITNTAPRHARTNLFGAFFVVHALEARWRGGAEGALKADRRPVQHSEGDDPDDAAGPDQGGARTWAARWKIIIDRCFA